MLLTQFQTVGHELFTRGLVGSSSGNLSIRMGDRIIITRRGSGLGCLGENDLIETGIYRNDRTTPLASLELSVHRAIYQQTPAQAIIHAHPPHAIALSLIDTEIVPQDIEGQTMLERVPVLGWHMPVVPGSMADIIATALKQHHIVLVHGHGSFATGQLLEEALSLTTALEESCQVSWLVRSIRRGAGQD